MFVEDAIRPFWAFGLNNIVAPDTPLNLRDWILEGNQYQINSSIQSDAFTLNAHERDYFLASIAKDCNRFSSSSIESIL